LSTIFIKMVKDKSVNGNSQPLITDIFTGSDMRLAFPRIDTTNRFSIIREVAVPITPVYEGTPDAHSGGRICFEIFLNFPRGIRCDFNNSAGTVGELQSNYVWFVIGTDGITDDVHTCTADMRMRYLDA